MHRSCTWLLAGLLLALTLVQAAGDAPATVAAAPNQVTQTSLTSGQVVAAFQKAGLSIQNLRQQPVVGSPSPSGPPATESEAWGFELAGLAPRGGRILVFSDDQHLQVKAAWFRRAGATVVAHRNVIVWLDPAVPASDRARFGTALQGLS